MKKRIWTASVRHEEWCITLKAQCRSSKKELIDRLVSDDPIWGSSISLILTPRWGKRYFRRGLAIRCFSDQT